MPARMHSRTRRRTAMTPPWPVSPSMMIGKLTACAIHPAIVTHSVMLRVPTSARPVYAPTTPPVPTKPASHPARSMILPCAAVGGCSTTSTLSLRCISSRRRAPLGIGVIRSFQLGLLNSHAGHFHHFSPARDFDRDVLGELLGRAA